MLRWRLSKRASSKDLARRGWVFLSTAMSCAGRLEAIRRRSSAGRVVRDILGFRVGGGGGEWGILLL